MNSTTITRLFPDSEAIVVHQNGSRLSDVTKGAEVILRTRPGETAPCSAEIISGDHHAEIGLWFEGLELCDYDGVFFLPREVGEMLRDAGFTVTEDCFA